MKDEILDRLNRIEAVIEQQNKFDKPLTLQQAAAYLDISPSHLYQLTSKQVIPHYKPGGKRIYFQMEDLNAYLLKNRVGVQKNQLSLPLS